MNVDGTGGWVAPENPDAAEPRRPAPPVSVPPQLAPARRSSTAGPPPLRPLTIPDVLDGAFAVLKAAPATLVLMAAVFVVPLHALTTWLSADALAEGFSFDLYAEDEVLTDEASSGATAASWVLLFGTSLAATFLVVGAARVIAARRTGEAVSPGPLLAEALRRSPALLVTWTFGHVLEVVAVVGLLVGTLVPMTFFFATAPVIVLEDVGPLTALRRSAQLVRRRFWPTLAFVLLLWIVLVLFDEAIGAVPSVIALLPGDDSFVWVAVVLTGILSGVLLVPVAAAAATLWYLDLRVRTEGLDLDIEAARVFPEPAPTLA
jgi:hypothetical protein